jgi:hypothetical protein
VVVSVAGDAEEDEGPWTHAQVTRLGGVVGRPSPHGVWAYSRMGPLELCGWFHFHLLSWGNFKSTSVCSPQEQPGLDGKYYHQPLCAKVMFWTGGSVSAKAQDWLLLLLWAACSWGGTGERERVAERVWEVGSVSCSLVSHCADLAFLLSKMGCHVDSEQKGNMTWCPSKEGVLLPESVWTSGRQRQKQRAQLQTLLSSRWGRMGKGGAGFCKGGRWWDAG